MVIGIMWQERMDRLREFGKAGGGIHSLGKGVV
jgi:hypothetical protein